jgi:hypothetical protein
MCGVERAAGAPRKGAERRLALTPSEGCMNPSPCAQARAQASWGGHDEWITPKRDRPRCGASCRSRAGAPCRARAVWDREHDRPRNGRCRLHGGLSTGATTPAGRARLAEAGRKGAAARWGGTLKGDAVLEQRSGELDGPMPPSAPPTTEGSQCS